MLLEVPRYDFNWQTAYRLAEPMPLAAGTRLHTVAHFDNSEGNLNNPDPTKTVRWDEQTWDEMMIAYYDYVVPIDAANMPAVADRDKKRAEDLFDRLDQNADGKAVADEVPGRFRAAFKQLDSDGDDSLSLEEVSKVLQFFPQRDHR